MCNYIRLQVLLARKSGISHQTDGQTEVWSGNLQNFLDKIDNHIFLAMGLHLQVWSSPKNDTVK